MLSEERSHIPLVNKPKVKKARRPIPRVAKKRRGKNAEYARRRIAFLKAHPFCQVWIAEASLNEDGVRQRDGLIPPDMGNGMVPASTEIHHTKKPKAKYLNDESTWLAVCRDMHDKIEANKTWAREKGYLQNI